MSSFLALKGRGQGASLVEVIVACGVVGLIMASAMALIIASYRRHLDGDTAATLNDRVLSTVTAMQRELKDGHRGSSRIFTSPVGIVFASARLPNQKIAFDEDNLQPIWQKWVCYYVEPAGPDLQLVRKEEALSAPGTTPPVVPTGKDTEYFRTSVSGGRVVARGVTELELVDGQPLTLGLTCREVAHRGTTTEREFLQEITTQVTFRN